MVAARAPATRMPRLCPDRVKAAMWNTLKLVSGAAGVPLTADLLRLASEMPVTGQLLSFSAHFERAGTWCKVQF